MQSKVITTKQDIPVLMSAKHLQQLGIARSMAYNIFNRADFPAIRIGNRKIIPKDKFFEWLDKQMPEYNQQNQL